MMFRRRATGIPPGSLGRNDKEPSFTSGRPWSTGDRGHIRLGIQKAWRRGGIAEMSDSPMAGSAVSVAVAGRT
jgi:hypothetical protein